MLRTILLSAATLTMVAATPSIAQTTTDDTYNSMPPPVGFDQTIPDDGYVDVPGTNHRDSADSPSSRNASAGSTGASGASGASSGTGSTGGGASARR